MGYPAIDPKQFARSSVIYKKLPEMYAELNSLKKRNRKFETTTN